jgi:hypothetical protein
LLASLPADQKSSALRSLAGDAPELLLHDETGELSIEDQARPFATIQPRYTAAAAF